VAIARKPPCAAADPPAPPAPSPRTCANRSRQAIELESDENGKEESTCDDWLGAAASERRGGLAWRGEEGLERSEGRKRDGEGEENDLSDARSHSWWNAVW
jgi:hypothetical protein